MTEEELDEKWIEDCKQHSGNLEYPLRGSVMIPFCVICKHSDFHYGTLDEPECCILQDEEYISDRMRCFEYECKGFEADVQSRFLHQFDDNYNPIPPDKWAERRKELQRRARQAKKK